ncbi:MAG: hypothetical protein Kow00121_64790 [Elainellaceae cyanobacterium]
MTSENSASITGSIPTHHRYATVERGLRRVLGHLSQSLKRDALVEQTVSQLRSTLDADRVLLYYFYRQWQGQVTFESLSDEQLSIFGATGADQCFTDEYAEQYLQGRVRAIPDIEAEDIHPCHRDFLRGIQVQANLVVPVLTNKGLWGLLVAHQCRSPRQWSEADVEQMQQGAKQLAEAPAIQES